MKRIHLLCVFLFLILCITSAHAAAEEEVRIRFQFDQTSYQVGEEVTAVYTITGGGGVYTDLLIYCIATDESSTMKLECEHTPGAEKKDAGTLTIPATVKADGETYKVTAIADKAFKGMGKLTEVTIGKNVARIGKKAFYGCAKLKTITVKTKKLTRESVGSGVFKGISGKATFRIPKAQLETYKTIFLKKGAPETAGFKKQ